MRVLVVDDSRAMRMILERELSALEVVEDVVAAASAEEAVERLGGEPVGLVVCDWNMGGMTGLELLEALRAAGWSVPFGFVTSESGEETGAAALGAGAAFVLAKPFREGELCARVAAMLEGAAPFASRQEATGEDREASLARLLEGLLRRPVAVVAVEEGPARQAARWRATYVDAAGEEVALYVAEMPLALAMSAALTMMPLGEGGEWARSGALSGVLEENLHEVTNVIGKAVHARGERCVLRDTAGFAPGEQLPEIERIRAAACTESFQVTVDGYGAGLLSLVTL